MDKILITLAVGTVGGLIGYYLKIPAGAMIGAMIAVGIYNIIGNNAYIPKGFTVALQVAAGTIMGARINKDMIIGLKDMVIPTLVIVFGVVIINFTIGFIITKFSDLDLATSLFASAPGGLTEMTLAADSVGADAPKVAILQLIRLVSVITFLPIVLKVVLKYMSVGQ